MIENFGCIPVASPLLEQEQYSQLMAALIPVLTQANGKLLTAGEINFGLPVTYLVLTGGTEQTILTLQKKRRQFFPKDPVVLLAHPGNNSLPAALETLSRIQQDGQRGIIHNLDSGSPADLATLIEGIAVQNKLQQQRIGLVGQPSDWLVASSPAHYVVRQTWGPQVIPIDLQDLTGAINESDEVKAARVLDEFKGKAIEIVEPTEADLTMTARVSIALESLINKYRLNAITVRCFDLVTNRQTTGCLALSLLNDLGIPAGCEGDLVSTIGMIWARLLTGQLSWMANPATVSTRENSLVLAHCTIARSLVKEYKIRSHFESGLGVGIQGQLPLGPVTLFRIGGRNLERLWLVEGELNASGNDANLCRTQATIRLDDDYLAADLLKRPLGNHLIMVPGRHAARLEAWWKLFIAE